MQQNPTKVSDPPTQLAKKKETLTSLKTQHRLNEILLGLKKMQDTEYNLSTKIELKDFNFQAI